MKVREIILSKKEKENGSKESCPEKEWFHKMEPKEKHRLIAMLIADPAIVVLLVYYFTYTLMNALLTYLIVDCLIVLWYRNIEIKRLKSIEEWEKQGDHTEIIRRKIQELREIEAEIKKSSND